MAVKNYRTKNLIRFIYICVLGLLFSFSSYAQINQANKGAHLTDMTSGNITKGKLDFSILDMSSSERGFLLTRMTTAERRAIPITNLEAGLMIYNTTIDCVEFYNGKRQRWMSICGEQDPAVFDITDIKCSTIKVEGSYFERTLVDERVNVILLEVNVSSPGAFVAEAIAFNSTTKNGYQFRTKGKFPTTGQYTIVLKGSGTPIKGYARDNSNNPTGKDIIKFYFNTVESKCTTQNIVEKDFVPLAAAFVCGDVIAEGKYKEKDPLTSANIIRVPVKVTKPGRGKVYGDVAISGSQLEKVQYESDVVDFKVTPGNTVQWIILNPLANTGKPTKGGPMSVLLKIISNGKFEYDPFADKTITEVECIHNIEVTSLGPKYILKDVTLRTKFYSNTGKRYYVTPRTDMGPTGSREFVLNATITPKGAGEVILKTEPNNGMYFYAKDIITDLQVTAKTDIVIEMRAFGISKSDLAYSDDEAKFVVTTNNIDPLYSNTSNVLPVDFVYRPMRVYSVADDKSYSWGLGGRKSWQYGAGPTIIRETSHFGWNGVVRIDGLSFVDVKDGADGATNNLSGEISSIKIADINAFKSHIESSDIVTITADGNGNVLKKSTVQLEHLAEKVKEKKVALIYGEGDGPTMGEFISYLDSDDVTTTVIKRNSGQHYKMNSLLTTGEDPRELIVGGNNHFGSTYFVGSLAAKNISASSYSDWFTIDNLSENHYYPIAGASTVLYERVFAYLHKDYGFVGVNNQNFMGGNNRGSNNSSIYPVSSQGKVPIKNIASGDTYNSFFLLNLMHWAIDYAQANQPNEIKP